jgi:N,N'-diacetyllegionaminate synthase
MSNVIIIAEAGVNHNGSIDRAKKMADVAKDCGVDYIKFQTGIPSLIISKYAEMAAYQKKNIKKELSQLEMVKNVTLKFEDFVELKNYCDEIGINFMSTPFDLPSIDFLNGLQMDYMKIPSGEITNYPYLVKIAKCGLPVIMSTGMSNYGDIEAALGTLENNGLNRDKIILLHCNTEYPTSYEDVNLRAMVTVGNTFGVRYGYSDHTRGIEVPIAAVAMGAYVIEKHFTLDRNLPGPDHVASLEPDELKKMVHSIRNIEKALGNPVKKVSDSERKNIAIARKSIIAAVNIKKGDLLSENNLTTKRPGKGISPMKWNEVIGRKAIRDFSEDEIIEI